MDKETLWRALEVPLQPSLALCAKPRSLCPTGACGTWSQGGDKQQFGWKRDQLTPCCVCMYVYTCLLMWPHHRTASLLPSALT